MSVISISNDFVNRRSQTPQSMRYSLPAVSTSSADTPSALYGAQTDVALKFSCALTEAIGDAGQVGWNGPGSNAADIGALTRVDALVAECSSVATGTATGLDEAAR